MLGLASWAGLSSQLGSLLPSPPEAQAQATARCGIVGNNYASPKGLALGEASTSLILLQRDGLNINNVVDAINSTKDGDIIIVRLGAGEDPNTELIKVQAEASQYAGYLRAIADRVNGKPFLVTATRNESNCAESLNQQMKKDYAASGTASFSQLNNDLAFAQIIISTQLPNVQYISGQVDYLCGDYEKRGDVSPAAYISAFSQLEDISGIALPYYTADAGGYEEMTRKLNAAIESANGKGIYITESGPFKRDGAAPSADEILGFAKGVQQVTQNTDVKAFLLFNSPYSNPETAFNYTKLFGNANCRRAFREQCNDPEAVAAACSSQADPEFLYPIDGLVENDTTRIQRDLINQGYNVQCTVPKIQFTPQFGPQDFVNLLPPDAVVNVGSSLEADYSGVTVPVLRDPSRTSNNGGLFADLESYFSFRDPDEANGKPGDSVRSAPIYALTTRKQQCEYKVELLKAIRGLCQTLPPEKQASCALYQPIPNIDSGLTTQTLLDEIESTGYSCDDYSSSEFSSTSLSKALDFAPLTLDKAYRLAFIVISAEYYAPPSPTEVKFNFFSSLGRPTTPVRQNDIRIIAIKIPDTLATNKDLTKPYYYRDAVQLTADTFRTYEEIQESQAKIQKQRDALQTAEPRYIESLGGPPINCNPNSRTCTSPLGSALVSFINKATDPCTPSNQDLRFEKATVIKGSGALTSESPVTDTLAASGIGDTADNPEPFKFLSEIRPLVGDGDSLRPQLNTYLVYPMGLNEDEYRYVQDTLIGRLGTLDFIEEMRSSSTLERFFKLDNVQIAFSSATQTWELGPAPAAECDRPGSGDNSPGCQRQVFFSLDSTPQKNFEPRIIGATIGKLLINIQRSTTNVNSQLNRILAECKTTEQFLLKKCGDPKDLEIDETDTDRLACIENYGDGQIQIIPRRELIETVKQEAARVKVEPSTLWGILQIEGSPYLRAERTGETSISCASTINSCGAVGPMQIIQGTCANQSCPLYGAVKDIQRTGNLCDIKDSLRVAADILVQARRENANYTDGQLAGRYHGLSPQVVGQDPNVKLCPEASPVQGCNGLNYCECAQFGFDDNYLGAAAEAGVSP